MIYIEELKEKISQTKQSEIGRRLLLRGLQIEYGLSVLPEISFGECGKPFFPAYPFIHFNISHCDKAVACIISNKRVGIDVETINPFDKELAQYICSPQELESVMNHPDQALAFTILWTKKESFCKLTGKGLNTRKEIQELSINETLFNIYINEEKGYVTTVCIG